MAWIKIFEKDEAIHLPEGEMVSFTLTDDDHVDHEIAIVTDGSGQYFAFQNICTHDDGPLEDGTIDLPQKTVECPRHGARFDIEKGTALCMPASKPIKNYPTKMENDGLYIEIS